MASNAPAGGPSSLLVLTPTSLATFKPSKVFRQHNEAKLPFTSLCFDDKGEHLITTGHDETLQLFNVKTGRHSKQAFSKKYGCHLARFTHKSSTIVHASTKGDDTIRYLSLHDNTYLRYFRGHKQRVTSLCVSPTDDTILSASEDDTVRLWDLRSPSCQGLLNIAGRPAAAFDATGQVFAVAVNLKQTVMLYDEPFEASQINDITLSPSRQPPMITSLRFSNDGRCLLAGTTGDRHYVLDGFNLSLRHILSEHQGLEELAPHYNPSASGSRHLGANSSEEVSWTPDSRFVLAGGAQGKVLAWDIETSEGPAPNPSRLSGTGQGLSLLPQKVFEGHMGSPCRAVAFNPKFALLATAGDELALWQPSSI